MGIETDFVFDHKFSANATKPADLLGSLRGLVGKSRKREWKGTGFNLIWRPNFGGQSGAKDFFLELNFTEETLEFTDITGSNGVANRGFLQRDVAVGALGYLQQITDRFDNSHQHFEPGVWASVPATSNPDEPPTVGRMGSIPHGTTINLQGNARTVPKPQFSPASITPFDIGSEDDGQTNLVHFDEEKIEVASTSRTDLARLKGLTTPQLQNPNSFLDAANTGLQFLATTVIEISSDTSSLGSVPDAGGGAANIAFLRGVGTPPKGGPNANVERVTAIFWIERVKDSQNQEFDQLQYTQRVLLDFNGLSWPHITVATLRPA